MLPLRLLLIEDSEDDAVLVTRTLTRAGYDVFAKRVDTAEALRQALDDREWDLAIADYTMPAFSGTKALSIIRKHHLDLPFIFVSGTIGEDTAVSAMKSGAHDYIMKGHLARLAPAVERELREAVVRRERTTAHERVAHLAYHDPLTDLPNRALLQDRMHHAILTSRREKKTLMLLVLDLDGFKDINDALGHHAGDRVLQHVAARLRGTLRKSDTVARLGGDEFAILLPLADLGGAELAARKVLDVLEQPCVIDGRPLVVHASIGIAGVPMHAANGVELLQRADVAMYQAKTDRSGYAVYAADRDRLGDQRLALTTALRDGIDLQHFVLDYQPVLHLRTGIVTGVEGLLRWDRPNHGRLLPKDFIQLAEHTGLINPLTVFAVERALADWPEAAQPMPLTIAVNLSPRSLYDTSFSDRIRQLLGKAGASPSSLALEITENFIMSDAERSVRCLTDLHQIGVRLVLDDFGTGYSSLSYLQRLPIDELKIDRSFVMGLASGEDDALVRSIIDLAHNLRLTVIAEGVEDQAVLDRLLALGCDKAQGYFIRRPAPAVDIARWIQGQNTRGLP